MASQSERVQALLAGADSAYRRELGALVIDALLEREVGSYVDRDLLKQQLLAALTRDNAERIAARHVLPALERIAATVAGRPETVRDLLSGEGEQELRAIVQAGKGPRYGFLRGAVDGDDLRQLIAPVVQRLLFAFTSRLPIPGLGGAGGSGLGGIGAGLGGIVGRIGKQVQRSAGQLADVGRSVFGNVIREFSETATSDFRAALKERLKSPEGQRIVARMRDRVVDHLLATRADDIVRDLMHLPRPEIASLVAAVIAQQPKLPLFQTMVGGEIDAALDAIGSDSVRALLNELGLYEVARGEAIARLEGVLRELFAQGAFASLLERLLTAAGTP